MTGSFSPWRQFPRFDEATMRERAEQFLRHMQCRRTVRDFSTEPVSRDIVDCCLQTAITAPSGANLQPWTFVVVEDPDVRRRVREAAEAEERDFYERRAPEEWRQVLAPLGTNASKPFLQSAPLLIAVFAHVWRILPNGQRGKNYYVSESVGIAAGFLIAALHHAGLATLTHTPSPMAFLNSILQRPDNERPYLLLVAGFPAEDCQVPDITRKAFDDVVVRI